jgi:hypothetical protein
VIFVLGLLSQVAVTPIGEGIDVYGHLAYFSFLAREGRWPSAGELSVPADIARLRDECLASDRVCPGSYARWAARSDGEREAIRRALLIPQPSAPYVSDNYQSQHPPFYYALLSLAYLPLRAWPLDQQVYWLSVVSVLLSATALPVLWLTFRRRFGATDSLLLLLALVWFPNLMPFLGRITNDALAWPLVCWFVYLLDRPVLTLRRIVAAGVVLAAGFLTKTYFLTFAPVYLTACLLQGERSREKSKLAWRSFGVATALVVAGLVPLLVVNVVSSGFALPLLEAQLTTGVPLWPKALALFDVDPIWFFGGLARNFFWSGYWSFVSPHVAYYLPLLAPLALLFPRPDRSAAGRSGASWGQVAGKTWLHLALLGSFLLGMWWHAALFGLDARVRHLPVHSGNEGWYFNVLLGSVAIVVAEAARMRVGEPALPRLLRATAFVMIAWNLGARLTMAVFWGGGVRLWSRLRLVRVDDFVVACVRPDTWHNWLSWPGVVRPVWLTSVLPLVTALALTWWVLATARQASGCSPS